MQPLRQLLSGRTAIVTGASSGNGRAISLALARAGANVVCSDLEPTARSFGYEANSSTPTHQLITSSLKKPAIFQPCDVSKPHEIRDLVSSAVSRFGRLDIMVNNAGVCTPLADILDETDDNYRLTMAVNVDGVYYGCKYAIRQFVNQEPLPLPEYDPENITAEEIAEANNGVPEDHLPERNQPLGKIINISSIGGMVGLDREPAYCASKGAVLNLTRQLALDFGNRRVNVNAICPGFLATAMVRPMLEQGGLNERLRGLHPWPRLGRAGDVAEATRWLSGPESDWVTGVALPVDGGYTCR